jgi:tetratricopeptide (TPR) repeat protein
LNVTEYTSLINKPDAINDIQSINLEKIVQEFPYFQSARAMYLKGLYNQNSFKYNYALKITAAHTTDRSVLFEFITSDTFSSINKGLFEEKNSKLLEIPVTVSETITVEDTLSETNKETSLETKSNTVEDSILTSITSASPAEENETIEEIIENITEEEKAVEEIPVIETKPSDEQVSENLELGKPLAFSNSEKHSFQEWLQLSVLKPIEREEPKPSIDSPSEEHFEKQKKNELIDKFIEKSPKIPAVKHDTTIPSVFYEPSKADTSSLMTETLARVYLEQKKYQKAIQAYQILILKYPEKSSFFADRILDIKNLQQNNK